MPPASKLPIDSCAIAAPSRYCLMTINHSATIGPCGPRPRPPGAADGGGAPAAGAGAGPRSGWKRYALCVFGSTVIVFAPANVGTVATTPLRNVNQLFRGIPAQGVHARAVRDGRHDFARAGINDDGCLVATRENAVRRFVIRDAGRPFAWRERPRGRRLPGLDVD